MGFEKKSAATKIQKTWRGRQGRKKAEELKKAQTLKFAVSKTASDKIKDSEKIGRSVFDQRRKMFEGW